MKRLSHFSTLALAVGIVGVLSILFTGWAADAQATAPATGPALSPGDRALLRRLETGTWRERKTVVNDLTNRGAREVPLVDQMLAITKSPDAKARLTALRLRLIRDRATGPSPITMHFTDASAKTVYTELFHQAWAPLLTSPDNLLDDPKLSRITINVEHQPFWLVMRELERTTDLGLVSQSDGYRLRRGAHLIAGPVAISGPFLVVLTGIRPTLIDPSTYWMDFSVYAEPKVHLLAVDRHVLVSRATDPHGNALQPGESVAAAPDLEFGPQEFSVGIVALNRATEKLSHLEMSTTASIAVQTEHVEIAHLTTAKSRVIQSGGVPLHFLSCTKSGSVFAIHFECGPDKFQQFQKINADQPGWQMRVLDAGGNVLPRAETVVTTDDNTNQMTLIYGPKVFGKPIAAPDRLIWNVPSEIQVVEVKLDFGDIAIPFRGS